jgi:diaminohydroxyphosphoribosylaminopyrimidine deaminase/5-amino-6-(5-phosphoribosylamino)uracil reductase
VPFRIVVDTKLRMPRTARMLREAGETIVFAGESLATQDGSTAEALREVGAQIRFVPRRANGRVDLRAVLAELGKKMCNDVLVEAGPTLSGALIAEDLVDELIVYIAPKLLGPDARPMAQLPLLTALDRAPSFVLSESERFGDDVKLIYRPSSSR